MRESKCMFCPYGKETIDGYFCSFRAAQGNTDCQAAAKMFFQYKTARVKRDKTQTKNININKRR